MHYAERPLPIGGRGNVVIIALAATMLSDVVAAVFEVIHYGILADLDRGVDLSYETVQGSDDRLLSAYGFLGLCYVGAGAAFLGWFHRVYRNLPRLGVWPQRFDSGWAVGAWLIPLVNLWQPKRAVNDAWRGSEPTPGPKRLDDHPHVPTIVHVWWAAWVVASLLWVAEVSLGPEAQTLPAQKRETILAIAADTATFVAALLAILVVRRLTKRQSEAVRKALAGWPPQYGWAPQPWPPPPPPPPPPGYGPG
jgi:eukaryotic-like serine/threonine-protein kinase